MTQPKLHLRIFLSSPGDVGDERGLARQVLRKLEKERIFKGKIDLEEVSWDDPDAAIPLDAHLTPQQAIDRALPKPSACDIVVVILWSRMGTPLPTEITQPDGKPYRSGTEYEFLDAIASAEKTGKPNVWLYRRDEELKVGSKDPKRVEIQHQVDTVEAFFAEFRDANGAIRRMVFSYTTPSEFQSKFEGHLRDRITELLEQQAPVVDPAAPSNGADSTSTKPDDLWQGNPYRGLDPFGPNDTAIFFGRGLETDELVKRIRDGVRVLAVIGASGSGKSSLVAAGLLPRLAGGAVEGSGQWVTVRFTPAEQGVNPFRALALALFPHLSGEGNSVDQVAQRLENSPTEMESLAAQILIGRPESTQLLLFADQFEELFTARVEDAYRQPFVALVEAIAASRRVRLVLTLRADYYEHCTRFPALAARLSDRSFSVSVPSGPALIDIIQRPALAAGVTVEPELLHVIFADLGGDAGSLALLEFTLAQLYEKRRDGTLSRDAYRALQGVGGAIDIQGEKAVRGPSGQADEAALWGVFDKLSEVDEAGGAVRRRPWLKDFSELESALVQSLIQARLLSGDKDEYGSAWVEVAHEAVLRSWKRFAEWLEQHREFKLWRKQLKTYRDDGEVLRGGPLARARDMLCAWGDHLDEAERGYIHTSVEAAKRRQRLIRGGIGLSFAAISLFGGYNYVAAEAERERRRPIYIESDWVRIEPGEFCMGSRGKDDPVGDCPELVVDPDAQDDEKLAHRVTISKAFLLNKHEVTFEEYDRFVYDNLDKGMRLPSDSGYCGQTKAEGRLMPEECKRLPVINVSWDDAQAFAAWLSQKLGKHFRLPSEAEWEYAARAGTHTPRFWPENPENPCRYANVLDSKNSDWLKRNNYIRDSNGFACPEDYRMTAPVGSFSGNSWGLNDMLGNVWEWVQDCYQENYQDAPRAGEVTPEEHDVTCALRVVRGGAWVDRPDALRSALRNGGSPGVRNDGLGFRLAQDL